MTINTEIRAALKVANELTLETQTIGEAVTDLVRLVRKAREERDQAQAELWEIRVKLSNLRNAIDSIEIVEV